MDSVIYALVLSPALTELLPKSGFKATPANVGFAGSTLFALFLVGWGMSLIWGRSRIDLAAAAYWRPRSSCMRFLPGRRRCRRRCGSWDCSGCWRVLALAGSGRWLEPMSQRRGRRTGGRWARDICRRDITRDFFLLRLSTIRSRRDMGGARCSGAGLLLWWWRSWCCFA